MWGWSWERLVGVLYNDGGGDYLVVLGGDGMVVDELGIAVMVVVERNVEIFVSVTVTASRVEVAVSVTVWASTVKIEVDVTVSVAASQVEGPTVTVTAVQVAGTVGVLEVTVELGQEVALGFTWYRLPLPGELVSRTSINCRFEPYLKDPPHFCVASPIQLRLHSLSEAFPPAGFRVSPQ